MSAFFFGFCKAMVCCLCCWQVCIFEYDDSYAKSSVLEPGMIVVFRGAYFSLQDDNYCAAPKENAPEMDLTLVCPNVAELRLSIIISSNGKM